MTTSDGRTQMPLLDRQELAAIFAGGCLGALARVAVTDLFRPAQAGWPWATFAVNVAGTFLLGYFATRLQERLPVSAYRRPLLGTGLCGALTTFSTVQIELLRMLDAGRVGLALGYVLASLVAGLAAMRVATGIVRRVRTLA
ncbi:MAG TPA: fluoride efflux transporter CrcB [Thermoleophilaceae bacterium]|jgi:CrcB protein